MSFSQLHKLTTYLISGLGLLALSLGGELQPLAKALIAMGWALSSLVEGPWLASRRYAKGWTAVLIGFLALQLLRAILAQPTLAMAVEFAAAVQVSRLFNRRTATDYQQIAVLAFLHLVAATVLSTDVAYALVFLGFVIATPWMLALTHLRREIEAHYPAKPKPGEPAVAATGRVLASRRVVGPGFLVGTSLLSAPLFLLTAAIFFTIPRVGKGFVGFGHTASRHVAGFGDHVELGGFGVIRDDPTVVLRVRPKTQLLKNTRLHLRLRGTSFDHYDGRRWTRSDNAVVPMRRDSDYYRVVRWPREADLRLRISLERLEEPVVFLPEGTVGVSIPWELRPARRPRPGLVRSHGADVRYLDPDRLGFTYVAYVEPGRHTGFGVRLSAREAQRYLQLPPGHADVAALARRWTLGFTRPRDKAHAILRRLRDEPSFRYSLQQPRVGNRTPLSAFLFEARRGHCEYFSTAMAIMLRSIGVPARNVTGFVGGRFNAYGDYYALRQGDAHSWVEAYEAGRGWVTYDPTPASSASAGPSDGPWSSVHALLDAARMRWTRSVVAYDLATQVRLLHQLLTWVGSFGTESRRAPGRDSGAAPRPRVSGRRGVETPLAVGAVALLFLGGWLAWRRARRDRPRGANANADPQVAQAVALYHQLERALAARGWTRRQDMTPREHVRVLSEQAFPQVSEVGVVTEGYMRVRYGGERLPPEELERLQALVARVRTSRAGGLHELTRG